MRVLPDNNNKAELKRTLCSPPAASIRRWCLTYIDRKHPPLFARSCNKNIHLCRPCGRPRSLFSLLYVQSSVRMSLEQPGTPFHQPSVKIKISTHVGLKAFSALKIRNRFRDKQAVEMRLVERKPKWEFFLMDPTSLTRRSEGVPKRLAERYMDTEEAFLAMAGSIGWRLKERERSEEFNNQRELVYVRGSTNGFLARNAKNRGIPAQGAWINRAMHIPDHSWMRLSNTMKNSK
ncbi:unnamed protein product [Nesidiocoris tenuis]|uniref:Uncharacterized protein n=1 Tax=Nesidiocoris tenuis TaxID=355587 RepID=A0A6H5GNW5_9HEMI|nr:unnamed protein product [Nesidiocoris tenuis]